MAERKKTGRPLKQHQPGELVNIGLQVPSEPKAELQKRARNGNRTLSQEIIIALEDHVGSPRQYLGRHFGEEAAKPAHLLALGLKVLNDTQDSSLWLAMSLSDLQGLKAAIQRIMDRARIVADEKGNL